MTREDCKFPECPYAAENDPRCNQKCQQPKGKGFKGVLHKLATTFKKDSNELVDATGEAIGKAKFDD
jgi:hypothetical protein